MCRYVSHLITLPITISMSIIFLNFFAFSLLKQERSSSDEIIGETSDIVSAISNEECSVASEILDQRASESYSVNVGEMIQDLNDDRIGHIDSPETSETTDALHGESLIDDISSVLGHDLFGTLQDSTITDDTTTLCSADTHILPRINSRTKSLKGKNSKALNESTTAAAAAASTQFGFENRLFDLHSVEKEPIRYCSLAKFEEGNDIARKSFRLSQQKTTTRSASIKKQLSSRRNYTNSSNTDDIETINITSSDTTTTTTVAEKPIECDKSSNLLNTIKIQIQVSISVSLYL